MTTMDRLRAQYALNATQLEGMATKAEQTGRKVNGLTAESLRESARLYRTLSTADDAALRTHLQAVQRSAATRLAILRSEGRR